MIILLVLILPLILLPLYLTAGWLRLPGVSHSGEGHLRYAILIPFRNEENRIAPLLDSLQKLNFPVERFSIWFLDDHSSDKSQTMVRRFCQNASNRYYHFISGEGKKAALLEGIRRCDADIIITTDADCAVPVHWLRSFDRLYISGEYDLIAGMVRIMPGNIWDTWQTIELAALVGVAGGMISWRRPVMCNGANLSFRKDTFLEVGGYSGNEHLPSGDDEFLLQKFKSRNPARITYLTERDSAVTTEATHGFRQYSLQRRRWASKWEHHSDSTMKWQGPGLAVGYGALLVAWIIAPIDPVWSIPVLLLTGTKLLADTLLIDTVLRAGGNRIWPIKILLAGLVYPFYFIYFAIVTLRRQYEWKGRRYSPTVSK